METWKLIDFVFGGVEHVLREHGEAFDRTFEADHDRVPALYPSHRGNVETPIGPHGGVVDVDAVELGIPAARVPQHVTRGVVERNEGAGTLRRDPRGRLTLSAVMV